MNGLDCAVIGAGVMGAAAADALARAGARVRLFDRFRFGHAKGSSHGPTRLFRTAYFEHPDYVPLARRSLAAWRELERAAGEPIYRQTGLLEAGPPEGFLVGGTRRAAELHGLAIENLSARALAERFGWFRPQKNDEALIEPAAGFLYADRAIRKLIERAKSLGARLHEDEEAVSWAPAKGLLSLKTSRGEYAVDRIIVATGAWAPSLLGEQLAPVATLEKALFWIGPGETRLHVDNGFIPFAFETPGERMFYGFPAIDGDGLKAGEHTGGTARPSPDAREGRSSGEERERFLEFLRETAPGLPQEIASETTCLYEMSPDTDFIIGAHPEEPRIAFATGHSGHGFKFAPVIGEALARLACGEPLAAEFQFLNPARF